MNTDTNYLRVVYLLLHAILWYVMIRQGSKMAKSEDDNTYWNYGKWIILVFSVVVGLRFGRELDWNLYAERYVYDYGQGIVWSDFFALTFNIVCYLFNRLGLPYWFLVWLNSIMFIYAILKVLKDYRESLVWILITIYVLIIGQYENMVRWYMGFAFIIMCYNYYSKSNYIYAFLFAVLGATTHMGLFLLMLLLGGLSLIKVPIFTWKIALAIYCASAVLGDSSILADYSHYFSFLENLNERAAMYIDNFNDIVTYGMENTGKTTAARGTKLIKNICQFGFLIYMSSKLQEKKKVSPFLINIFYIGVIIYPVFMQVEILTRYARAFIFFASFVIGMTYQMFFSEYFRKKILPSTFSVLFIISLYGTYASRIKKEVFQDTWFHMMYIWDANNQKSIDLIYYRIENMEKLDQREQ